MKRAFAICALSILATSTSSQEAEQEQGYVNMIENAKKAVTAGFKDPDSAQWRGLFLAGNKIYPSFCGEVNGRNSYGGYVGFKRFFSSDWYSGGGTLTQVEGKENSHYFEQIWKKVCVDKSVIYTAR